MGKGEKNHGNREAKKPKKEKPKVLATANFNAGIEPMGTTAPAAKKK